MHTHAHHTRRGRATSPTPVLGIRTAATAGPAPAQDWPGSDTSPPAPGQSSGPTQKGWGHGAQGGDRDHRSDRSGPHRTAWEARTRGKRGRAGLSTAHFSSGVPEIAGGSSQAPRLRGQLGRPGCYLLVKKGWASDFFLITVLKFVLFSYSIRNGRHNSKILHLLSY